MAVRIYQAAVEVFASGDSTVRIYQAAIEVLHDTDSLYLGDTLEMSDGVAAELIDDTLRSVSVSDDLNNWDEAQAFFGNDETRVVSDSMTISDSLAYVYAIAFEPLTKTVSDNFITTTGPPPRYSWKDALESYLAPFGDLDIRIDEMEQYLADEVSISQGLIPGDQLEQSDEVAFLFGSEGLAYDSLWYNFADNVTVFLVGPLSQTVSGDSADNWLDSVQTRLSIARVVSDSLSFYDYLTMRLDWFGDLSDSMEMSDSVGTFNPVLPIGEDTMNMSDAVETAVAGESTVSVADTLSMSDSSVSPLRSTSFVAYIRRYLNDVP